MDRISDKNFRLTEFLFGTLKGKQITAFIAVGILALIVSYALTAHFVGKGSYGKLLFASISQTETGSADEDKSVAIDKQTVLKARSLAALFRWHAFIVAAGFFTLLGLCLVIVASHSKRIDDLLAASEKIAQGQFSQQFEIQGKDEVSMLSKNFNRVLESFAAMNSQIKAAADAVASTADEIEATVTQINNGAKSQASAADETSSSMEEMSINIKGVAKSSEMLAGHVIETTGSIQEMGKISEVVAKNAEEMTKNVSNSSSTIEQMVQSIKSIASNVRKAHEISTKTSLEAQSGGEKVIKTLEGIRQIDKTMAEVSQVIQNLGKSSESIGGIVKVIEEISDQTNLLALNAAIEAARAGDAGRGFAVVADEVRKLAERSIKATSEIADVIKQVQKETSQAVKSTETGAKNTREGITLADQAGSAIKKIMEGAQATSNLMENISIATEEQTSAAENVIKAVEEINSLTQQVSDVTKEQAKSVQALMKVSEEMYITTEQVKNSTNEQKMGGESVVMAIENINQIAKSNLASVEQLSIAAKGLSKEALGLTSLLKWNAN